ncbi:heme exporter protein CcmD [Psychromonas antarctica]|uniref:heme exporter protein CcmD n=1 Tax=Psychromonas antarctica TaxID=67573 RepID=UPI001EE896D6|nr:heme exporter protein CcmD [Psychromonas antarctica]MCG6199814.1 heme exporter protein CcmD [Psychromonas antarctica]
MAFNSIADFFSMGGYGFYVWLSYCVSFLSLIILIINTINRKNKIIKMLNKRIARQQRIKNAPSREGIL